MSPVLRFFGVPLAVVAALSDATSMTIPNWISAALVLVFLPAALLAHAPAGEIGWSLALGLGALVAGVGMFALRWIGGGDAKLFAAGALWLGPAGAAPFLLWTAVAGGVLALGLISARREGRRHIYTVEDPHVLTLVQQIFAHIAPDGSLAPDPPLKG